MIRRILKALTSRLLFTILLILAQCLLFLLLLVRLSEMFVYVYITLYILSLSIIIYIINEDEKSPSLKILWLLFIALLPLAGGVIYLFFGRNAVEVEAINRRKKINDILNNYRINHNLEDELRKTNPYYATQAHYISKVSNASLLENTQSSYLNDGEVMFKKLCEMLEKAEHYIFLEFFIITEGYMWDSIIEILKRKVKSGVEVRVIYDDIGCIKTLPNHYNRTLESYGIKCGVFNPFIPILSIVHNNRDHRKIAVVDGYMAINGGINIGDEYINKVERFGHWKDTAIYLEGEAVHNLTLMFLENWYYCGKKEEDYGNYYPLKYSKQEYASDGYYQSYGDSPIDNEQCGQNVYMNVLNHAHDYVYITTPYLIIDYEFLNCIKLAAKRGVDVRLITPHIPDKWYVHLITRAFYRNLMKSGVRIYEYTPGFIHAKTMVADDSEAIVGTINLDYRSLVHHYECATIMYNCSTCLEIKQDFMDTLDVSEEMTKDKLPKYSLIVDMLMNTIKLFAPLM